MVFDKTAQNVRNCLESIQLLRQQVESQFLWLHGQSDFNDPIIMTTNSVVM